MASIDVTNSTLDPQLIAILNSKVDTEVLMPSTGPTQDQLDNTWGTAVFHIRYRSTVGPWTGTDADGIILQVGSPNNGDGARFQLASAGTDGNLLFRINDANDGTSWSAWRKIVIEDM